MTIAHGLGLLVLGISASIGLFYLLVRFEMWNEKEKQKEKDRETFL